MKKTLTALAAVGATALALAPSASAVEANCPGTFDVLHNDRIGNMQLPKGPYVITVLDTTTMGCTEASRLFSEFLEDWDGKLPRPWVVSNSTRTFRAGRGSSVGFRVTPDTNPNPPQPPAPPSRRICPGYFSVLHNDRIGSFNIPKGRYRITLLSYTGVSCSQAVRYLQRFLQDFDGVLPRPWQLGLRHGHVHARDTATSASASSRTSPRPPLPARTPARRRTAVTGSTRAAASRSARRRSGCCTTTSIGIASPEEGQLQRLGQGPELPTLEPAVRPVPGGPLGVAAEAVGARRAVGHVQARPRAARSSSASSGSTPRHYKRGVAKVHSP